MIVGGYAAGSSSIEGSVELFIGYRSFVGGPGAFVSVPRGIVHTYRVLSQRARYLLLTSQEGAAGFFLDLDRSEEARRDTHGPPIAPAARICKEPRGRLSSARRLQSDPAASGRSPAV